MEEFTLTDIETLKEIFATTLRNESKLDIILNILGQQLADKRNEPFEKIMAELLEQAKKNHRASLERLALQIEADSRK